MDRGLSRGSLPSPHLTRRGFLGAAAGVAGAAAAAPFLAACSTAPAGKTGAASVSELARIMPDYVPRAVAGITPEFPSMNGSPPGYLSYPTTLTRTVSEVPGNGGTYTAITPLWGSIPSPAGNTYYQAVNAALGATVDVQPANGLTYSTILPPLFAGNKVPHWIQIPSFWTAPLNFGEAAADKLADLTPYLAGGKINQYPNLAAIFSGGWQAGIWNNRIYGIPEYTTQFNTGYTLYYRADILDKLGIGTPSVTSAADLLALGKEINDPAGKRWAFDDIWGALYQPFEIPSTWTVNDKGDLVAWIESPNVIEAMNWQIQLFKQGLVNPDSVAGDTSTAKQRFWSGQMVITADGTGAWNYQDAISGAAANKSYVRSAFNYFAASGTGTPSIPLENAASFISYLNKDLKPSQIEELLRIANFLAAPYGSYEYTLIQYGAENTDWTMGSTGPVLNATGLKQVAGTYEFLASPNNPITNPGYPQITTANCRWNNANAKYAYKPLFYDLNVVVPTDLTTANSYAPFSTVPTIMYEVVRGRSAIADYQAAVKSWQNNGGNKLRAFYESVRAKYGTA
jgi:putative aldouronate transport system substrate-binding protein